MFSAKNRRLKVEMFLTVMKCAFQDHTMSRHPELAVSFSEIWRPVQRDLERQLRKKCESVLLAFTAGFHVPTFQNS